MSDRSLRSFEPCLPRPAKLPPAGDGRIHEIKHDGFRILAHRQGRAIRLISRNSHDLAGRFPQIVEAVGSLPDDKGLAVFALLREQRHHVDAELCAFDMIELDGEDLRRTRIEERKRALAKLVGRFQPGIVVNEYFEGDGAIIYNMHARLRRHRVQTAWHTLPGRSVRPLAQNQKPRRAGGAAA